MKFYATVCRDGHKVSNTLIPKNQKNEGKAQPCSYWCVENMYN